MEPKAWELKTGLGQIEASMFMECVAGIAKTVQEFSQSIRAGEMASCVLKTRQISVELRKLLLDGGGMIRTCIAEPTIHPLLPPNDTRKAIISETIPPLGQFEFKDVKDGRTISPTTPTYLYETTIHPLYGVSFKDVEDGVIVVLDGIPFDLNADPVKFSKWMRTMVVEIETNGIPFHKYRSDELLYLMANREGAHSESTFAYMSPVHISPGEQKDRNARKRMEHSAIDAVRFGVFSYIQYFAVVLGNYIVGRTRRNLLEPLTGLLSADPRCMEWHRIIALHPYDFPREIIAPMTRTAANPTYILGDDDQFVGGDVVEIKSLMKIPAS